MTPMDAELAAQGFTPPTPKAELRHILHDVGGGILMTELCKRFASRLDDLRSALAALRDDALVEAVTLPGNRVGVRWTGNDAKRKAHERHVAQLNRGVQLIRAGMTIGKAAKAVGVPKSTMTLYARGKV